MRKVILFIFLCAGISTSAQVYVPGDHNDWDLDAGNQAALKSNLGVSQIYYGITLQISIENTFKVVNGSFGTDWGGGYWITSYNQRWAPSYNGADAVWKGSPNSYVHMCIEDPADYSNNNLPIGIMTLSASPVSISTVNQVGAEKNGTYYSNTSQQTVSINLSAAKSNEENIYLRYTTDNWATDNFVLASGSSTSYSASIPIQTNETVIQYYVLTTTLTWASGNDLDNYPDLMTINYDNNSGDIYKYTATNPRSITTGDWDSNSTWLFNSAPTSGDVIISGNDNVTLNTDINLSSLTIETDGTFTASDGVKATRTLTISGGGIFANNGTFIAGSGKVVFEGAGAVSGSVVFNDVSIAGGVDFGLSSTINNSLTILANGSAVTNAPTFTASSDLIFATGGAYSIQNGTVLWTAGSTVGEGVPSNVIVTTTTPLNIYEARDVTGNLTINSGASVIQGNNDFIIHGNLINAGAFSFVADGAKPLVVMTDLDNQSGSTMALSANEGGDLKLEGNFDDNGTFTANGRAVFFQGSSDQNISSTTNPLEIDVMRIDKTGGEVILDQNLLADETADPLDIGDSDVLNLNGHKLTIGKTGVTSIITMSSGSKIVGSSTSSITILGNGDLGTINLDQTTTGTTNALLYLTITREPGSVTIGNDVVIPSGGVWTINSQSALTVDGALTNNAGASGLLIKSTSSGMGSLITNGSVIGDITVERYLAQNLYHYISSPINYSSGTFDDLSMGLASGDDFRRYETSSNLWIDILNGPDGTFGNTDDLMDNETFVQGKGYAIAYAGENKTLSLTGAPNNGDIDVAVLSGGVGSNSGSNFIGNPYPSTIQASSFLAANNSTTGNINTTIAGTLFFWDEPASGPYEKADYATRTSTTGNPGGGNKTPTDYIDPGQGFFVYASSDGNVAFHNNQRVHGPSVFFKNNAEIRDFKLSVQNLETLDRNTITVVFDENSTTGFDLLYDSPKWQGNPDLALYSLMGNQKLAINSLPALDDAVMVNVGLYAGQTGNYTFSLHTMENFEPGTPIVLEDRLTGEQTDLSINPEYTFTISEPGTFDDRFVLYFKSAVGVDETISTKQPIITIQNNQLNISNLDEGKVEVRIMDIMGRVLDFRTFNTNSDISMPLKLKTGLYVLEISSNQSIFAHKFFIQ